MLDDKSFQKGFLIIQILAIVLIGTFIYPFAFDMFEDYSKLPQAPIYIIEVFFAILVIIFASIGVKLLMLRDNKFKIAHLILNILIAITFIVQITFCVMRMGGNL